MQKMRNSIQHYAWGSTTALTELYGIENKDNLPMAELWMGAHPKSSSWLVNEQGQEKRLRDVINDAPVETLGAAIAAQFGELPFLFKVLCAAQPLSIQVHPSKPATEQGFAKENRLAIPLYAPHRNYKDANHKPELVFALTPFQAMNGFREHDDIVALLQPVAGAHPSITAYLQQPDDKNLSMLFANLLSMRAEIKDRALAVLKAALTSQQGEPWATLRNIIQEYPNDSGLFSPLLLNVITLQPGQAMFLYAETPHAYLNGVALEVMANSDNVLRAGLTPKYIDIPELLANVKFIPKPANQLLTQPIEDGETCYFPVPVADFAFSLHHLKDQPQTLNQQSAAVVFCIDGKATLMKNSQRFTLRPGESCFLRASESPVIVEGSGRLARVYNG
ncbi:mannose-6-phosphate isomerase [Candidatus Symbiopectobacterium endolongispinus]|uniref:mannose-6-phosphate isomerase n=1 Tax=Candidatus Symbiopectobacterium endolongispinus TaxID=2812664 RepID=UPI00207A20B1|nr:mannose-6-phosphate isomerase [Candidatus Symbiopectobacterium endolongispinus]MBT9428561.1 mannose-6-phosphate isomerase [Candidatus Symbiopectobacterium endolongispinus]